MYDCVRADEITNFLILEICASAGAERRNILALQGIEIRATVILPDAMEKEGTLAVVFDYPIRLGRACRRNTIFSAAATSPSRA
jgi:hypothetical protein